MVTSAVLLAVALLPALCVCSGVGGGEAECTLHQLQSCLESLQSVTQGNDFALVTTRAELQAVCNKLKESVGCVDEHMRHCFSPTQRKVFNSVVAGARQFLAQLCVPGPIQEAYLRHSPCYRNVSTSEGKCAPRYHRLLQISESVNDQGNVDDRLRQSCCAFNDFVLCKYTFVTRDCGPEAAHFLQEHLDQISSPLLHEHCAHYTYASDSCSSASHPSLLVIGHWSQPAAIVLNLLWSLLRLSSRS